MNAIPERWSWAFAEAVECPACRTCWGAWVVIAHLNDTHGWPREEIGRWVATIEPTDTDNSPEVAWRDQAPPRIRAGRPCRSDVD